MSQANQGTSVGLVFVIKELMLVFSQGIFRGPAAAPPFSQP